MGEETAHVPDTSITSLTPSPPLSSSLLHSSPLPPFLPFSSPSLSPPTLSHSFPSPQTACFREERDVLVCGDRIGSQCSTTHSRTRRIWYGNTSGCADVCVYNVHVHVHIPYPYLGMYIYICDRICENRPPCKKCTLEIWVLECGHVVLDPNFFYYTTVCLGPFATCW